jgi:cold-inducible RNA-binding protein
MASKLYVGGLSYSTTSEGLRTLFAQYGTVESAAVVSDRDSGQSRGFGFVEMSTQPEAQEAIAKLDGQSFEGRPLKVNVANPKGAGGGAGTGFTRGGGSGSGTSFGGGDRRPSRW